MEHAEHEELEVARRLEFHGVAYIVTVSTAQQQLHVQVEVDDALPSVSASPLHSPRPASASSPAALPAHEWTCWTGSFPSAYVEELTRKTGNYKRFPIFVSMLVSAISHRSDAVFIDLLTASDLELYRKRKFGRRPTDAAPLASSTGSTSNNTNSAKRYLILTYAVEFDRVHYPLPLTRAQSPTPEILQRTIRRLRQALAATTGSSSDVAALREENRCLKSALAQQLRGDNDSDRDERENVDWSNRRVDGSAAESPIDLQRELKATLAENREVVALYEQLRVSSAAEIAKLKAALRQARAGNASDNADERSIQRLQQQLEHERTESRRKLHDSNAVVEETLAQLKRSNAQCDALQLKNRELMRQLAIARARVRSGSNNTTNPNQTTAATRTTRTVPVSSATATASRHHSPVPVTFRHEPLHYSDSDGDDSDRDRTRTPARRPPFRRFDPTAYQQERQRKLRAARSQSPSQRVPRTSYNNNGGYTSDSSNGGYSSATSNGSNGSNGSNRRGRTRSRVLAEHQRAVVDRLASPKRVADPDAHFGSTPRFRAPSLSAASKQRRRAGPLASASVLPPPHPTRLGLRSHPTNPNSSARPLAPPPPAPLKRATTGPRKRVPPTRTSTDTATPVVRSSSAVATALLADTTADSFSDIDDRLTALQQFLKQAKQGGSGSSSSGQPPPPLVPPTVK